MKRRSSQGITLQELLVTMVIAGILATLAGGSLDPQIDRQNLKAAQQTVAQALKTAQQLARTGNRSVTVDFYPQSYNRTPALVNQIRICSNPDASFSCDSPNWTASGEVIRQQFKLPNRILLRRASQTDPVAQQRGSVTFDNFGGVTAGANLTVFLSLSNLPSSSLESNVASTATLDTAFETALSDVNTGAGYNAVTIASLLGKVRIIP